MANSKTLWECVLCENTRKQLKLNHGVTIPFMVGVYFEKGILVETDLQTKECIRRLCEWIITNKESDPKVLIFWCDSIKEYIIQYITAGNRTQKEIQNIQREGKSCIEQYIYLDDRLKGINNLDDLINKLWDLYSKPIINHTFSCQTPWIPIWGNKWEKFSKNETKIIKSLK